MINWQTTYAQWVHRSENMTGEERLWSRALCHMINDAIDGPCEHGPDWDTEGVIKASRAVARFKVETMHEDFTFRCECAGISPDAVSEAFRAGDIKREQIEHAFRKFEQRQVVSADA